MSTPSAAVSTPIKIDPAAIKAEHGSVPTSSDAAIDIHVVLSSPSRIEREKAAVELVDLVKLEGPQAFVRLGLAAAIEKGLADKKNPIAREGACELLSILVEQGIGNAVEPFFFEKLMKLMVSETFADKVAPVRVAAVDAVKAIITAATSWATLIFLPILLEQIKTAGKWQVKTGCLEIMDLLVTRAPDQCARAMPDIIPVMVDAIWGTYSAPLFDLLFLTCSADTKSDVKKAARASLTKLCALVSNKDIEKFIPALISSLINPVEEVPTTIQLLAATTFVSEVDSPTLALMAPLLSRGLAEKLTSTVRKVAVIIVSFSSRVRLARR